MKAVILYRPNSDHERRVLDYVRDVKMQTGKDLPMLDVDTPEGQEMARLYDVVDYPTLVVTDNEGHIQNMWASDQLPTISEAGYYVQDDKTFATK